MTILRVDIHTCYHKTQGVERLVFGLTRHIFVLVPCTDLNFQCSVSRPFFFFKEMRVTVCFVDIGGIDDHHCSHFHFIITQITGIAIKIYFYNVNNKPLSPLKPGNPNNPWCPLSPLDPFVPLYPIWSGGKWSKNIYIHQNWHYMISWQTKRVWLTRLVSYKKQELLTLREHLSSPRVFCLVASMLLTFLGCLCCPSMCLYVLCFVL